MRISTPQMNYNSMEGVRKHAEDLYGIQAKLSSGQRVMTPGDDSIAASRIYRIDKSIKQMDQLNTNAEFAKGRLNLEDATLGDFTDVVQRIRELGILGMSDTQNSAGRKAIAAEMRGLLENLKAIANTQDSNGEFIMSGDKTDVAPYQPVTLNNVESIGTGMATPKAYFTKGNGVTAVTINKIDGTTVVMDGVAPNPAIPAANQIVDNFNGKIYTLNAVTNGYEDSVGQPLFAYFGAHSGSRFVQIAPDDDNQDPGNDTGDASRVRISDQGARTFGNYTKTSSTPWAPGYDVKKNPQLNYNIFDTLREMANQLDSGTNGVPNIANNVTRMDELMAELDTSLKAVSDVRTDVGTRLQRIDMQYDMNQDFKGGLTENLSKLRDQDMVTGISDYQKTLSGLQMAQLTYSKISELSLFNYLR
jgi:flagellar hook-associated protein 3 FlgL